MDKQSDMKTPAKTSTSSAENVNSSIMYVSWAESCSRSDHTARELGGKSYMVYLASLGSHPATILPKYCCQFLMTCWLLILRRPSAVIVMSPPIFAAFAVYLYHFVTRRPYALDCHTAAFTHPRFRRLQWLQAWLERRAAVNIVHNDHLRCVVESRGGRAIVVSDVPVVYETDESYEMSQGFNVTVVCSFNPDEPIAAISKAASLVPDVQFYMTGNPKHLAEDLSSNLPPNVQLTGFVSEAAYGSLICNSDIVMSLTTRDHTMLRGAWEAIYQSTPVIVSDWPILKEAFSVGALHVDNSPQSIANAVQEAQNKHDELRSGAQQGREQRIASWQRTRRQLLDDLFGIEEL